MCSDPFFTHTPHFRRQYDEDVSKMEKLRLDREADEKKEIGNEYYKQKNYETAVQNYTAAINLRPERAAFYGNRSACYVMLGQYNQALDDVRWAITLDRTFTKGYVRIAKCCLALGDLAGLKQTLKQIKELGITENMITEINALANVQRLYAEAENYYNRKVYSSVVSHMDGCLELCPASDKFKLLKSECLAMLGRCDEAQEIADDICNRDNTNADALFVCGICLYFEDKEETIKHFQRVLKLAPDHKRALEFYKKAKLLKQKKEEGNEKFKIGKLEDAYKLYSEALKIDPFNKVVNVKLLSNQATVCLKLGKLEDAVENCTKALDINESHVKALTKRAKCYSDLEMYEEAVRDYEKLLKLDHSQTNKRLLQDAKLALEKCKSKNYYEILGVEKDATEDEIKKAYRKMAFILHPDRHVNASKEERRKQERRFKELGEAHAVLSDPLERLVYDYTQRADKEDAF